MEIQDREERKIGDERNTQTITQMCKTIVEYEERYIKHKIIIDALDNS